MRKKIKSKKEGKSWKFQEEKAIIFGSVEMADVFDLEDIHPADEGRRHGDSDDDTIEIDDVSTADRIYCQIWLHS